MMENGLNAKDRKSTRLTPAHSDLVCRLLLEKKNASPTCKTKDF